MSGFIGIEQRLKQRIELDCTAELWLRELGHFGCTSDASSGPLPANKEHSFHKWRGKERREALSISGAERSRRARKRARRGFGLCAAQSCTREIERRSRPELKTSP